MTNRIDFNNYIKIKDLNKDELIKLAKETSNNITDINNMILNLQNQLNAKSESNNLLEELIILNGRKNTSRRKLLRIQNQIQELNNLNNEYNDFLVLKKIKDLIYLVLGK